MLLALQLFNAIRFATLTGVSIILAQLTDQRTIFAFESLILIGTGFTFFFVSGLGNSLLPIYKSAKNTTERRAIFPSAFLILLLFSVVSIALMNGYNFLANDADLRRLTFYYSLFMFLNLLSMIAENFLLAIGRLRMLVWWGAFTFSAYVLAIALPVYFGEGLDLVVLLLIFLGAGKLVIAIIFIHRLNGWHFSRPTSLKILRYASPIMLSLFIANAYIYFNSFWIREQFTEREFNLFRYGSREFPLFIILANSFSTIQSGILAQFNNRDQFEAVLQKHRSNLARLMNQLFPVAILLILFARPLFGWVFTGNFIPAADIFTILLFGVLSRLLFPQSVLMAMHKTRYALYASVVELTAGLILSIVLGSVMGIKGVALAMVIAAAIDKLVLLLFLKNEGINYLRYVPVWNYLTYTALMVGAALLMS